jgi:hypothetical protein
MRIGLLNSDPLLERKLSNIHTTISLDKKDTPLKECEFVFIDYIPTSSGNKPSKAAKLLRQTSLLEECVKNKKPFILFDRYLGLKDSEYKLLSKTQRVIFLEPALNFRTNFSYLPFWYEPKILMDIEISRASDRPYLLGYKGRVNERIKAFESYYLTFAKDYYAKYKIAYDKPLGIKSKELEYTNFSIECVQDLSYSQCQYTIIIGTELEYHVGYLDSYYFEALRRNCVPLLTNEHRYFKALGGNIWDGWSLDYLYNRYDVAHVGMIHDIYKSLDSHYPEMRIDSVIEMLNEHFKNITK